MEKPAMQVTPTLNQPVLPYSLQQNANAAARPLTREDMTLAGITRRILAMDTEHSVNLQA